MELEICIMILDILVLLDIEKDRRLNMETLSQEELELLYWETVEMEEELSEEIMSEELLRRV